MANGSWLARSADWRNLHVAVPEGHQLPFGRLIQVRVLDAGPHFLRAELA